MRRSRQRFRPGSYLDPIQVETLLPIDADLRDLDARLLGQGFRRSTTVRPYFTTKGLVTLRFCWRKRDAGLTHTHVLVWRLPMQDLMR